MIKINRPQCPNPEALRRGNYKHPDNKAALISANFDKCMYCESKISHVYFGDVEHIIPESKFPKLKFEWSNLGYACSKCNNEKNDKYFEDTPFIDPYQEEPEDYIIPFGTLLYPKKGSERGEITIEEIGLNNNLFLVEKRQERIDDVNKAVTACFRTKNNTLKQLAIKELIKESERDKEYSLFIKYLLKEHGIV